MPALANGLRLAPRAKPAQFDADQQLKRSLIGKIKLAQKSLQMDDDDYRQMLLRVTTTQTSTTKCSVAQLTRVVEEMKRLGFVATPRKPTARRAADHPTALKARALWISLHHLGAVQNPTEPALEAFARRQLKCDALQWADGGQMFKLIEALKAMAEREGWSQDAAGIAPARVVPVLKLRLCEVILGKLQAMEIAPHGWNVETAAARLCGIRPEGAGAMFWQVGDLDLVAKSLGAKLRDARRQLGAEA